MTRYCYCYACKAYCTALGQSTRCLTCGFELAELSQCGMLHYETSTKLQAQALTYKRA